jgi:uncharacterized protein (UPF0212 family)
LLSPEWFDFGMDLLLFCVSLSNQEALKMKGNDAWKMTRNAYLANDNICNMFLKCASHTDSILSNKEKEAVFVLLAIKVFNAHSGHELECIMSNTLDECQRIELREVSGEIYRQSQQEAITRLISKL